MAQVQLAWSSSTPTEVNIISRLPPADSDYASSFCSSLQVYPRGALNAGVHFNARGELIPYAVVPAVASLGPPDAMTDSPETDDDDDMGLELAYPDDDQLLEARPPPLSASPLVVPYISRTQPITTPTLIYSAALPYTPYPAPPAALPPSQTQTRSRPITTPTPTPPTMYTLPYTAPYTPPYTAPSAAPRPQPPQTQPQPRKRIPLPRRTPRKSAPGACAGADAAAGPSTNMVAAAAAALRQSGPRLPASVVAYAPMAPGIPIPIYTHAPPPMVTQVIAPPPVSAPAPADAPCVMGCGGRAPAKGRRCLSCVRGSWAGRGRAAEEARVKAGAEAVDKQRREKEGTPKKEREGRVTIKLRVTPKAAGRVVVVEPKGKGKAVDPEEKKGKSESVDPKAIEMDAPLPLVGTPAPPSTPKPKDSSPENKTGRCFRK
ncbi:hypothetical protein B0H11DRAFT_2228149 [Mycena galericulata]|nr:hypothetical protein B0H11DRAFT_2228149 [Mycena galericulata]